MGTAISKGVEVKVTLLADAVQDTVSQTANKSAALATATSESTTTPIDDVRPVIAKIETKDSNLKEVLVDFDEAVTVVDSTKFKVQVNTETAIAPKHGNSGNRNRCTQSNPYTC